MPLAVPLVLENARGAITQACVLGMAYFYFGRKHASSFRFRRNPEAQRLGFRKKRSCVVFKKREISLDFLVRFAAMAK